MVGSMSNPDEILLMYSDGREPLRVRDRIRDNPWTMCREYLDEDGNVYAWVRRNTISMVGSEFAPWGTYKGPIDEIID